MLPGVATGDDLRSEFSVRGSNFSHMHLTLDGFTTPYLLHAVRAVEDESSSGSVAMINSDILQDVALVSGGYVQRSGNRTGASVEFNVRSGSRERTAGARRGQRDGRLARRRRPLARRSAGRGWCRRVRAISISSSTGWSTIRCSSGSPTRRRRSSTTSARRSALQLTLLAGRSRLKEPEEEVDGNDLYLGLNASAIGIGTLAMDGAAHRARRRRHGAASTASATRRSDGTDLDNGREQQLSGRFDARHQLTRGDRARSRRRSRTAPRIAPAAAPCHRDDLPRHQRLFG